MKKICAIFLTLLLCLSVFASLSVYGAETDFSAPSCNITVERPPKNVGTTPLREAISLFEAITPEQIDISQQIYTNILKQNPDLFIFTDYGIERLNGWDTMTDDELEAVEVFADELLDGCTTADEKILTVANYVAKNIGYDFDYYYDGDKEYEEINHSAYDVLLNESAVCYGYSTASAALLQLSGVPCTIIMSPGHAWNMAYNGNRWILFDTTWMSNCVYKDEILTKSDVINDEWFDYTIDFAHSDYNHLIEDADYCEYDNAIYTFPVYTDEERFTIPQYITKIGEYAFCDCTLDSLTFNGTLSEVEMYAFANCRNLLGDIHIEDVVHMSAFAFYECEDARIIFGNKLESADTCAFYDCTGIKGDVHLENLTTVGDYAFYECAEADIYFGDKLINIGKSAFYECESAKGIIDLRKAETVGEFAFHDCASVTGIILGEKIDTVPYAAFNRCSSVKKIFIPKNITVIEDFAFQLFEYDWNVNVYYDGTKEEWNQISVNPEFNVWLFNYTKIEHNYKPHMAAPKLSNDKKSVTVNYDGIPLGETVYFAEYENGKFLGIRSKVLSDTVSFNLKNENTDKVTFFIMKDSESIFPAALPGSLTIEK